MTPGIGANGGEWESMGNLEGANGGDLTSRDHCATIGRIITWPCWLMENVGNVIVNGNQVGCSYKEFLACNPGKGGVVVLTRWIEKIESMYDMSSCSVDQKVKYTGGSFVGKALTW
ncbi:hypothetical protein Tco_0337697 [Tanacetum coccineum]